MWSVLPYLALATIYLHLAVGRSGAGGSSVLNRIALAGKRISARLYMLATVSFPEIETPLRLWPLLQSAPRVGAPRERQKAATQKGLWASVLRVLKRGGDCDGGGEMLRIAKLWYIYVYRDGGSGSTQVTLEKFGEAPEHEPFLQIPLFCWCCCWCAYFELLERPASSNAPNSSLQFQCIFLKSQNLSSVSREFRDLWVQVMV